MIFVKGQERVKKEQVPWDLYFLKIAKTVGENSKCLSRHIGTVLVRDKVIVSEGYNGPPRGYIHCGDTNRENKCPRKIAGYKSGEGLEICPAAHAERNALLAAARLGIATNGATLYCSCGFPCKECLIEIIQAGVSRIVCTKEEGRPVFYDAMSEKITNYYLAHGWLKFAVYMEEEV